ncbi:DJ-1/PfpI family protein [Nitratidesulfovibrio liaohensis]|uniref:DJ-1/PfpI family protein n=1 Tax=Nitratidesulfovibrio liaohensis TaxID=2604158 RepID=A0ABY9QZX6_9BACT|nr:DJ-1/PfpI family protein [Nitratidesulfovibrio liaohensis]WMW64907.1 DJ-1/PfpI family protein [Nitratidesulfovibrio liaohensis]
MTTYGLYIYEQVAEQDFVGPQQVFAASRHIAGGNDTIVTIAARPEPLRGSSGLHMIPDHTFADAPSLDVLVLPGTADVTRHALSDPGLLDWVRAQAATARWVTAVCTGTLILHAAGLLRGRRATTWAYAEELGRDPQLTLLPDMRYVRDGNIVTSQGVSAGIDMALWLVGQMHDPDHARAVRRLIQYDPAPPYTAEV